MTSLWRHLWPNYNTLDFKILTQCVKLLGERVLQVWWWYLHWFRRYRKKTRGGLEIAPPVGRGISPSSQPLGQLNMSCMCDWHSDRQTNIRLTDWGLRPMTFENIRCHISSFDATKGNLMSWFRILDPFVINTCRHRVTEVMIYPEINGPFNQKWIFKFWFP